MTNMEIGSLLYSRSESDSKELNVFFLVPNGLIIELTITSDDIVKDIKDKLWEKIQRTPKFRELVAKKDYVLSFINKNCAEELCLDEQLSFSDYNPNFRILQVSKKPKDDEVKEMEQNIMKLIGSKDRGSGSNDLKRLAPEVTDFREEMTHTCFEIGSKLLEEDWREQALWLFPPVTNLETKLKDTNEEVWFHLDVVFKAGMEIKDYTNVGLTVKEFIDEKILKNRKPDLGESKSENVFVKVLGKNEYLLGNYKLYQYEYVQQIQAYKGQLRFKLIQASKLEKEVNELTANAFPPPKVQTIIRHAESVSKRPKQKKSTTWDEGIEDRKYTINIRTLSNLDQLPVSKSSLFFRIGIYYGGSLFGNHLDTRALPIDEKNNQISWDAHLTFEMELCNIPKMAKLCFLLMSVNDKQESAVGWFNIPIFDYKCIMKMCEQRSFIWLVDDFSISMPNFLGTVESNLEADKGLYLTYELCADLQGDISFPPLVKVYSLGCKDFIDDQRQFQDNSEYSANELVEALNRCKILTERAEQDVIKDKEYIWKHRIEVCADFPDSLPVLLLCVQWKDHECVAKMQFLLQFWENIDPPAALELLDYQYSDNKVREYAIGCLKQMSDKQLELYLLQLIQAVKYELYIDNDLVRFILDRCIKNAHLGQRLFWLIKSELHAVHHYSRFVAILEVFFKGIPSQLRKMLNDQVEALGAFRDISLRTEKQDCRAGQTKMMDILKISKNVERSFKSILDPTHHFHGIKIEACKLFDSAKRPLMICFQTSDENPEDNQKLTKNIIFKFGDDLRQDMLITQTFKVMNQMWENANLKFRLIPYGVLTTGDKEGVIEMVSAVTLGKIHQNKALINEDALINHLRTENKNDADFAKAVESFSSTCTAYCVATYVLGIFDRHFGNIMLKSNGEFLHIDFGHILGERKHVFGINKDKSPFVLTKDIVRVIERSVGGEERFKKDCEDAFMVLYKESSFIVKLFLLMVNSGMPEVNRLEKVYFLNTTLVPDKSELEAREHFRDVYKDAIAKSTNMFNLIHKIVRNDQ